MRELRHDVQELSAQSERTRGRLHDLEGFAKGMLDIQREHRRQEDRQYRRVSQSISFGSLAMALAMVALTVVTILIHHG